MSNKIKDGFSKLIQASTQVKSYLSEFGEDDGLYSDLEIGRPNTKEISEYFYKKNKKLRKAGVNIPLSQDQLDQVYRCQDDIFYFSSKLKILTATEGIIPLEIRPFQQDLLSAFVSHNRVIINASRQIGKSTVTGIYVIHYAMFNDHKNIWILANKGKTAKSILRKLKIMYESLPIWLQVGIVNWTSEMVEFENGTVINVGTTTSESARSETISLLILDEFGRILPHIEDDFVTSVFPTVSSSPKTQIIIISTPKGMANTFYRTCRDAKRLVSKESRVGSNGYMYFEYDWKVVPERLADPNWIIQAKKELKNDERKFAQEYCCAFMGSVNTIVDQKIIEGMIPAKQINDEEELDCRIYNNPVEGRSYISIVDIAKGVGRTASTIQVFDITDLPFRQVMAYENKNIGTYEFTKIAVDISTRYNRALMFIENNGIGESVCVSAIHSFHYDNVFMNEKRSGEVGICASTITKDIGASEIGVLLKKELLVLYDDRTIGQLTTFINDNGYWKPDKDCYSDLVMPVVHFGYILNNRDIRVEYLNLPDDIYRQWAKIEDLPEVEEESKIFSDFDDMVFGLPIMVSGSQVSFVSEKDDKTSIKTRSVDKLNKRLNVVGMNKHLSNDEDDEDDEDDEFGDDHYMVI
jgi:hypothetical protein